ncbi:hypothetical protein B5X24_HaOG212724 [Helicoverpa armigera]|nr:hypothetical protein B5X24_HaOG212724 [Helicoverpa armigera]
MKHEIRVHFRIIGGNKQFFLCTPESLRAYNSRTQELILIYKYTKTTSKLQPKVRDSFPYIKSVQKEHIINHCDIINFFLYVCAPISLRRRGGLNTI